MRRECVASIRFPCAGVPVMNSRSRYASLSCAHETDEANDGWCWDSSISMLATTNLTSGASSRA